MHKFVTLVVIGMHACNCVCVGEEFFEKYGGETNFSEHTAKYFLTVMSASQAHLIH